MELEFSKMHGAGNDFMVMRWPDDRPLPGAENVRRWADRRTGVGFDQLLLVQTATRPGAAAYYHVFNADGGEVQQCGNGVRCVARYVAPDGVRDAMVLDCRAGPMEIRLSSGGDVRVNLGEPDFSPSALPFRADRASRYRLDVRGTAVEFGAVSMGNPHIVIPVDSLEAAPVGILGPQLQSHPSFPEGVNVGFVEICDPENVRLRVFERGAGETSACGTGAAAAVAVGRSWGRLGDAVTVQVTGGTLRVGWPGPDHPLWLSGPAERVFDGRLEL